MNETSLLQNEEKFSGCLCNTDFPMLNKKFFMKVIINPKEMYFYRGTLRIILNDYTSKMEISLKIGTSFVIYVISNTITENNMDENDGKYPR